MKHCIHCASEMPDEAHFCLVCGKPQTEPHPAPVLRPWRRKLLFAVLASILLLMMAVLPRTLHLPKTWDAGGAEIVYTDREGRYRIFLTWTPGRGTQREAMAELSDRVPVGLESAVPSLLYVYEPATDQNLQDEFLQKVRHIEVQAEPVDGGEKMGVFGPASNEAFPYAALAADIVYTAPCRANDIVWTLDMKNGDRLILRQRFTVETFPTATYTPEDIKLDTPDALRALFDRIAEEDSEKMVTVYLPAVSFEGDFVLPERGLELIGTIDNGRQTTFYGHLTVTGREIQLPVIRNVVLDGSSLDDHSGTGLISSTALLLYQCTFRGWETGVLAQEGAWVGIHDSLFENNDVGFLFDSSTASMADAEYSGNRFLNNRIAVSLERVPSTLTLTFPKTVFSGNETDILNTAEHAVNIDTAVFR